VSARKILLLTLAIGATVAAFVGGGFLWGRRSTEYHAAHIVANTYASKKDLSADLTCWNMHIAWDVRGKYKLCCFVFEPRDRTQPSVILVRYTATCPLNTFEVGMLTRADRYQCESNTEIHDTEYIQP
jgi:hypothetical protein